MRRSFGLAMVLVVLGCLGCANRARAQGFFGSGGEYSPTVLTYAFDGFWAGALVGTSGGYIAARKEGFERDDWRPLVLGGAVGALSGTAIGLTLGFVDLARRRPGIGGVVLRDMFGGAGLGLLVGIVGGALAVIKTREPEHIGFGAAIGVVAGAGLGLVIGFIEGPRVIRGPKKRDEELEAARLAPTLALLRDHEGKLLAIPAVAARF